VLFRGSSFHEERIYRRRGENQPATEGNHSQQDAGG
jgi:hypothetical protein